MIPFDSVPPGDPPTAATAIGQTSQDTMVDLTGDPRDGAVSSSAAGRGGSSPGASMHPEAPVGRFGR